MTIVEEARQIVNAELDADVAEKLALWQEHVNSVKLKGGPGSGHHGHRGRPGKRGGSAPGSVGAYVTIYHGTPAEFVESIKTEGLKRGSEWYGRPPSVYYLTNREDSERLAKDFIYHPSYAIIEAKVPKSLLKDAEVDEIANNDFSVSSAYSVEIDIDSSLLSSIDVYQRLNSKGQPLESRWDLTDTVQHIQHVALKEQMQTLYIIVAFDESTDVEKQLSIDPDATTEDHESLLRDDAIELRTASMSSSIQEKLIDKYNQLLEDPEDAERVRKIRAAGAVPPPILSGTEDEWTVIDGMHRISILAFDGVTNFPAYFMTPQREVKEFIEKQLPIDQDSKDVLLQLRVDILKDELDSLAEQMFSGDITLNQYHENFKSLIKEARSSAAAIGKGGWDQMGPRDWGRLGTPNREQYKYLQGFVQTIDDRRDTITLEYIKNRGRMYADAIAAATTQAEAGFYFEENLPWLPKDGSTTCLTKCHCYWRLSIVESQKNFNVVEAVWTLGEADHCTASASKDGCLERAGYTEVMRVPKDVEVPAIIGGY